MTRARGDSHYLRCVDYDIKVRAGWGSYFFECGNRLGRQAPHQCSRDDPLYFTTNEEIYYVTKLIISRSVSLFSLSASPVSYPTQKIISKLNFCA